MVIYNDYTVTGSFTLLIYIDSMNRANKIDSVPTNAASRLLCFAIEMNAPILYRYAYGKLYD
jgi:hypothetical protein